MFDLRNIPFFDGYWYCYSNSVAMMLGAWGENISPHLIEPLTGVGLGSHISSRSGLPFFSGAAGEPDQGITKALEILGFQFMEKSNDGGEAPFDEIEKLLNETPVVIGPLDMSFLCYNPDRPKTEGVDHYILVYKIEGDKVFVNDPAGFAGVYIGKHQLAKAWKADGIGYKRGNYRYWAKPVRINSPSEEEIYQKAICWFKELNQKSAEEEKQGKLVNGKAVHRLAEMFQNNELKDYQIGFLNGFSLPLGVKRSMDYGRFFEKHNQELSELSYRRSEMIGNAQSLLMDNKISELIEKLREIAGIEDSITQQITKA